MDKKIDKYFDALGKIQQTEPPPFLFTRIQEKTQKQRQVSVGIVRLTFACFLLLAMLNVFALQHLQSSGERNLAEVFHIMPENNFYE